MYRNLRIRNACSS